MDALLRQPGEDNAKLTVANKRLAANNRNVQRTMAFDEGHEALDELVALVVREPSEGDVAAEVVVAVRVAARASKRTFLCDLYREIRTVPLQNPPPCLDHISRVQALTVHVGVHYGPVGRTRQTLTAIRLPARLSYSL